MLLKTRAWMFGVLVLCLITQSLAEDTATVYVEPAFSFVDVSDTAEVGIVVAGEGVEFRGYVITFEFDPDVVEFLYPAIEGSLFVDIPDTMWTWFEPGIEESVGRWEVWDTVMPGGAYVTAPGELFRLRFHAVGEGISGVRLVDVWLYDPISGTDPIEPMRVEHGTICVGDQSGTWPRDRGAGSLDLGLPYPNPTSGATCIPVVFRMGGRGAVDVSVGVYDVIGRLVTVIEPPCSEGISCLVWDGCDSSGRGVGTGAYFLRLRGRETAVSRSVIRVE